MLKSKALLRTRPLIVATAIFSSSVAGAHAQETSAETEPAQTPTPAAAELTGSDIVVTARRSEERLQDVPVAITALSGDDLTSRAVLTPTDLNFVAPSVQMTTQFGRLSGGFSIRGLSGGVQAYFAEIPGGPTSASTPFYDIESVQVLNGPQGTLFGRANTAGAVLVTPAKPKFNRFEGSFEIHKGNLDMTRMTAIVNIPIVEDQLAARIAVNHFGRDGYTKVLGGEGRLNEDNNWGLRASINWNPGGGFFSNYAVLDWHSVDQAASAYHLAAINPNLAIFNLPVSITSPGGAAVGETRFGSVCRTAVSAGLSSSVNGCIDERLRKAATFKPALLAEYDRVRGGGDAIRSVPGDPDLRLNETLRRITFANHAELDFGEVGPTTVVLRNIFGFQAVTGATGWDPDGLGGLIQNTVAVQAVAGYREAVSAQQVGGRIVYGPGPYQKTYSSETQLQGVVGNKALVWNIGYYVQTSPGIRNLEGIRNVSRTFSGITLPTMGFSPSFGFADGGTTRQEAAFGQATLDVGALTDALRGIHLTGGVRKTWDSSRVDTTGVSTDLATGNYVPTGVRTSAKSQSSGWNYTFSADWRVSPDLMIYGTHRKGYRPGGVNDVLNSEGLPNFKPTFAPETVEDYEIGAKYSFRSGDLRGTFNLAAYDVKYGNIQRQFIVAANGVTTAYWVNAAGARIRGLEGQFDMSVGRFGLNANIAYSDPKFTSWFGADPLALIGPGNAACLPGSTATFCLLDLADTPFPNISKWQGSVALNYVVPLGEKGDELRFSGTAYYQTRRYFTDAAQRNIEAFGEEVRDAISQRAYARFNLRAEWQNIGGSGVSAAAFVNNVTDKVYKVSTLTQLQSLGTSIALYGEPRTYGLELKYKFGL